MRHPAHIFLAVLLTSSTFIASAAANNTGGEFANRSNLRPANTDTKIITRSAQHDYSPTIMKDVDGKYKMWWCGSNAQPPNYQGGDQIYYSESTSLASGWTTPVSVFRAAQYEGGSASDWDGDQTCDPSVVRVDGTYYLFYTGINNSPGSISKVGVVTSTTGAAGTWTRPNGNNPIVSPYDPTATIAGGYYGVGHPSVMYIDGWFYLYFDDDTGVLDAQGNPLSYPQGFIYRSTDPTFPNNSSTQELLNVNGTVGFQSLSSQRYPIWNSSNGDLVYHPGANRFAMVLSAFANEQTVVFFNRDFVPVSGPVYPNNMYGYTDVPGKWVEGAAIVRSPFGHSLLKSSNILASQCVVPLDVIRTVGDMNYPANATLRDLAWSGMDLTMSLRCGDIVSQVPLDIDGDRITEPVIYRPSNTSFYSRRSTLAPLQTVYGSTDYIPVHGDFDNDGIDDLGGVNPTNYGANIYYDWTIRLSSNGTTKSVPTWGIPGDAIALEDYDGDGKDDPAVYRESTGTFYVWKSTTNSGVSFAWGGPQEVAVPGDFDLDGLADRVVYYKPNGVWDFQYSTGIPDTPVQFGGSNDGIPFVGDFFGGTGGKPDGHLDIGYWKPSDGTWHVRSLASSVTDLNVQWGLPGDVPKVGDFNGDGILDFAVWRPSNGNWYYNFRNGNTLVVQWGGLPGDVVPTR